MQLYIEKLGIVRNDVLLQDLQQISVHQNYFLNVFHNHIFNNFSQSPLPNNQFSDATWRQKYSDHQTSYCQRFWTLHLRHPK